MLLALAGFAPTNKWLDDYTTGYRQASASRKPLAVVVGRGPVGWNTLDSKAQQLLKERYVCVYVDASQEQNKALVAQLKTGDEAGLVLSDSTGEYVAFRHTGLMTAAQLDNTLKLMAGRQEGSRGGAAAAPPPAAPVAPPMMGGGCYGGSCGWGGYSSCGGGCYGGYSDCGSSCGHHHGCRSHGCRSHGCRSRCGGHRGCGGCR
jgi:hypothetical protein